MMSMKPICGDEWVTSASTKYGMNRNMSSITTSDFAVKGESGEVVLKVPSTLELGPKTFKDGLNVLGSNGDAMYTLIEGLWKSSYTVYIMCGETFLATIKTTRMSTCRSYIYAGEEHFNVFNSPTSGNPPVLCMDSSAGLTYTSGLDEKALKERAEMHTNLKFYKGDSFDDKDMVAWTSFVADELDDTFGLEINAGQDAALILAATISAIKMMYNTGF